MRIESLEYSEYENTPQEWRISDLFLRDVNLLVGKNASGKSRVVRIINSLALAIAGKRALTDGTYDVVFRHNGDTIQYQLAKRGNKVEKEVFLENSRELLRRGPDGVAEMLAEKQGEHLKFQPPEDQLVIVARRDKLQHSYFEVLHDWAKRVYCYQFGTPMGQHKMGVFVKGSDAPPVDVKNQGQVVGIFRQGQERFDDEFTHAVRADLRRVGYEAEEVGLRKPFGVSVAMPGEFLGLFVKEHDLAEPTDQNAMSQGMFRALSLLAQINYAILAEEPACILVDDIGEGLDFERSCGLIDAVISRAESSGIQLVIATNDRFVMNRVPLEAWSVLCRHGSKVTVRNYKNSREAFDEFSETGLNNFDFFALDYLQQTE